MEYKIDDNDDMKCQQDCMRNEDNRLVVKDTLYAQHRNFRSKSREDDRPRR